jgi:hypothetical protein
LIFFNERPCRDIKKKLSGDIDKNFASLNEEISVGLPFPINNIRLLQGI